MLHKKDFVEARKYLWSKRTGYNAYASKLNLSSSSHMVTPKSPSFIPTIIVPLSYHPSCFSLYARTQAWQGGDTSWTPRACIEKQTTARVVFLVGNASFRWASCAHHNRSCSWTLACPQLMCTSLTALCSDRSHVFLLGLAARQQPTIVWTQLRCWWAGQKGSLLLCSGSLQFGWPQHGWPTVTPSILSIVHH